MNEGNKFLTALFCPLKIALLLLSSLPPVYIYAHESGIVLINMCVHLSDTLQPNIYIKRNHFIYNLFIFFLCSFRDGIISFGLKAT